MGDGESPRINYVGITPGETEEQSRTVRTSTLQMLSAELFGTKVVPRLIIVLFLGDFLFKGGDTMVIIDELKSVQRFNNSTKAAHFHKTGVGEYQHGDVFWDIPLASIRKIIKSHYQDVSYDDIETLLASEVHEVRLSGFLILTELMNCLNEKQKPRLVGFYLEHLDQCNGWDLVDLSAPAILGTYILIVNESGVLDVLAKSENLWHRRVAIVSTLKLIRNKDLDPTYRIVKILLQDREDLIHKACGWMLREAGKQNRDRLNRFLQKYYNQIPRTTLRYAIEKHEISERLAIMKGNFREV